MKAREQDRESRKNLNEKKREMEWEKRGEGEKAREEGKRECSAMGIAWLCDCCLIRVAGSLAVKMKEDIPAVSMIVVL